VVIGWHSGNRFGSLDPFLKIKSELEAAARGARGGEAGGGSPGMGDDAVALMLANLDPGGRQLD
jgi:hypothetical protein